MSASRAWTLLWAPRRIFWSVRNPNQRSTWLIQDDPVGVKCMWKRGWRASQARTAARPPPSKIGAITLFWGTLVHVLALFGLPDSIPLEIVCFLTATAS